MTNLGGAFGGLGAQGGPGTAGNQQASPLLSGQIGQYNGVMVHTTGNTGGLQDASFSSTPYYQASSVAVGGAVPPQWQSIPPGNVPDPFATYYKKHVAPANWMDEDKADLVAENQILRDRLAEAGIDV